MKKSEVKNEEMNVDNVEQFIKRVIDIYQERGLIADMFFWERAIAFLKQKEKQKTAEAIFSRIAKEIELFEMPSGRIIRPKLSRKDLQRIKKEFLGDER